MTNPNEQSLVAVYDSHTDAESAVGALAAAGIDVKRLSIVGKHFRTEEHPIGFYTVADRMTFWGGRGAFWGSLWGVLVGGAFFVIPGVGPIVAMGPLVGWLVGAIEGAVIGGGLGVVAAALTNIGIPGQGAMKYDLAVRSGKFLVLAQGEPTLVALARETLGVSAHAEVHP